MYPKNFQLRIDNKNYFPFFAYPPHILCDIAQSSCIFARAFPSSPQHKYCCAAAATLRYDTLVIKSSGAKSQGSRNSHRAERSTHEILKHRRRSVEPETRRGETGRIYLYAVSNNIYTRRIFLLAHALAAACAVCCAAAVCWPAQLEKEIYNRVSMNISEERFFFLFFLVFFSFR